MELIVLVSMSSSSGKQKVEFQVYFASTILLKCDELFQIQIYNKEKVKKCYKELL